MDRIDQGLHALLRDRPLIPLAAGGTLRTSIQHSPSGQRTWPCRSAPLVREKITDMPDTRILQKGDDGAFED